MYGAFNDWQITSRKIMEIMIKNLSRDRLDSDPNTDPLAFGDQLQKRHQPFQPFSPMQLDPNRNPIDNLKRQRSVPNVQGHHRHWRQRRFPDSSHDMEAHGWQRNNPSSTKDSNNRHKWTIVSPEMYHSRKTPNPPPFRKPEYQDNPDNQTNRFRPKLHPPDCVLPARTPIFNSDHDKTSKWPKYHMYPSMEEQENTYKGQVDNQNVVQDDVQPNHMVLLNQIEPRCSPQHNDQQPVDLEALFQGYRVANEDKTQSNNRKVCKFPSNQSQRRYGCYENKGLPPHRGRRWYGNYNFYPPPWVNNPNYTDHDNSDDLHEGVYMKPGSYDVPKREIQKPLVRQFPAPPPPIPVAIPPSVANVNQPAPPRFKPDLPEVTWQAALASAETLCKSLRSNDGQVAIDNQQQWVARVIRSSSGSDTDEVGAQQSHSGETNQAATQPKVDPNVLTATDSAAIKTVVKKVKQSSRERKPLNKGSDDSPPPPPSPPPSPVTSQSSSPSSQPLSAHRRSISPSASRNIQRFLETVWAVKEASHMKFSPDQEQSDIDGKKVLEDTFQRLLNDGWAASGAAAAAAAAVAAVSRCQNKQQ